MLDQAVVAGVFAHRLNEFLHKKTRHMDGSRIFTDTFGLALAEHDPADDSEDDDEPGASACDHVEHIGINLAHDLLRSAGHAQDHHREGKHEQEHHAERNSAEQS